MAFDIITSSIEERGPQRSLVGQILVTGAVSGVLAVYVVAVGIFQAFSERWIVSGLFSLAHLAILSPSAAAGFTISGRLDRRRFALCAAASLAVGCIGGLVFAGTLLAARDAQVRALFVALSPNVIDNALLHVGGIRAILAPCAAASAAALCGFALAHSGPALRRSIQIILLSILAAALLKELISSVLQNFDLGQWLASVMYASKGMTIEGMVIVVIAATVAAAIGRLRARKRLRADRGMVSPVLKSVLLVLMLVVLPIITNSFISQVLMMVGLYALMGMGLNIELGLAGLLDLGFVAFFAIGAYATALLTSASPLGIAHLSFWTALPIAVLAAAIGGSVFGLPVLRVRGDYLALATLALGEIIRILVVSDMLRPYIGGAQGILGVPRPSIGSLMLVSQTALYYLTLALTVLVGLVGWRLQNSPIGRAWMAAREDEDVAAALGVDLVKIKLLAYTLGAAFAGVAGAIFATMLGSIFPQSFQLLISINVLALLIVGGLGSFPGVFIGALVLIGLPELLREFGEFRYLLYGILLIVAMRYRPEGLWPAAPMLRQRR
ncbi:MAG: branched-chain amino acid ABC transporter permease [Alphaproteobacteria bacterium]